MNQAIRMSFSSKMTMLVSHILLLIFANTLKTYSITDDDLFRDSYILTMTQSKYQSDPTVEDFDVTQMADAAFESFAEVIFFYMTLLLWCRIKI